MQYIKNIYKFSNLYLKNIKDFIVDFRPIEHFLFNSHYSENLIS